MLVDLAKGCLRRFAKDLPTPVVVFLGYQQASSVALCRNVAHHDEHLFCIYDPLKTDVAHLAFFPGGRVAAKVDRRGRAIAIDQIIHWWDRVAIGFAPPPLAPE